MNRGLMNLCHRLARRLCIRRRMRRGKRVSLESAAKLWALSDIIFIGPTGPSAVVTPECELYRFYRIDPLTEDAQLQALLSHRSGTVAGYAFEILLYRGSPLADEAVRFLQDRKEEVTMGFTSFVVYSPICKYVSNRMKAYQKKGGVAGWP